MTYWLSRAGATQAEGPLTPRQIRSLWSQGQITAEDQLCPTDVPDGWVPADMVVDELEQSVAIRNAPPAPVIEYAKKKRKALGGGGCAALFFGLLALPFY